MIALLLLPIAVLLLLCTGLTWALVIADRALKSRSLRLHHQAERIRDYRAENRLLAEAVDRLTEDNARLTNQATTAAAALTPDVPAERPWPRWGHRTLRQIHTATSPADFDRKDNR